MGYVFPKSQMDKMLNAKTEDERRKAVKEMLDGYNGYRAGMRKGIFGAIIGNALFPESKDRKL